MGNLVTLIFFSQRRYSNRQNYAPLQKSNYNQNSHSYIFVHDQKYITHINTYKTRFEKIVQWWSSLRLLRSMCHHKQSYNLNQRGGYAIHDVIVIECEKYTSTTIHKPATILEKLNTLHGMQFLKITPNKKRLALNCTITQ